MATCTLTSPVGPGRSGRGAVRVAALHHRRAGNRFKRASTCRRSGLSSRTCRIRRAVNPDSSVTGAYAYARPRRSV